VGVLAVAVGFGIDQLVYHSEFIIVMRDPASYIQFGNWIAHHGSLPIPQDRAAFGGAHPGLHFDSFAFYQVGDTVVPQFMAGLPMILAGGFWIGGVALAAAMGPVLGALAVLTFGGLAARLVGPRWAPLAALVLAISLPELFTSRSAYSEPLVQILFLGGFCLVIDSLGTDGIGSRVTAALGGLALGLTLLVRIDGASDILPVIPYCGPAVPRPPPAGSPASGWPRGRRDLRCRRRIAAVQAISGQHQDVTGAAGAGGWRRGARGGGGRGRAVAPRPPEVTGNWLPNAVGVLAGVVMIGFAVRPYLQTVHAPLSRDAANFVASMQRADHLPIDPTRLYYEISLHWVFWYIARARRRARHVRGRVALAQVPAGPGADLDAAPHDVRVDHCHHVCTGRRSLPINRGPAAGSSPPCCPASSSWPSGPRAGWSAGPGAVATTG